MKIMRAAEKEKEKSQAWMHLEVLSPRLLTDHSIHILKTGH